ncbi:histidine phosphatase family protein [Rummeliibacillus pycnus]|uniref:histidine phosphatase family protein n=1 Tax=Rummeliibacillus pycnus TaxID=101070 RepID=UPI000C9B8957|nr:histidine phosphatase family protein [Rummeliibacillus pycnus]
MVTLYITRHGETEWNCEERMQGWLDSNLTEKGENNARLLGQRLENTNFAAIFSSPSGRTKATANLIRGDREIPIYYDDQLKEMNMGMWEGKELSAIKEMYPVSYESFWNSPHLYKPIEGETFEETRQRASQIVDHIKKHYKSGNILIVTHSIIIKCLLTIFKNATIENLWTPPYIHDTSLSIVEINNSGYQIILEGDISHTEDNVSD